jgi:hypothetical protein
VAVWMFACALIALFVNTYVPDMVMVRFLHVSSRAKELMCYMCQGWTCPGTSLILVGSHPKSSPGTPFIVEVNLRNVQQWRVAEREPCCLNTCTTILSSYS